MASGSFARLDGAKQRKIIDAAFAEFAEHGYQAASTNRIVAKAGISKGMLFHYFSSKQRLFYFLVDCAIAYITERYINALDADESDFIERCLRAAQLKSALFAERPYVFHFLSRVYLHELETLPPTLRKRIDELQHKGFAKLHANVDASLFRDDVDADIALKIIGWVMDGYQQQLVASLKSESPASMDAGQLWDDYDALLATLRRILYR